MSTSHTYVIVIVGHLAEETLFMEEDETLTRPVSLSLAEHLRRVSRRVGFLPSCLSLFFFCCLIKQ
jgi:hypothetical protein